MAIEALRREDACNSINIKMVTNAKEAEEYKIVTSVRADSLRNLITEDSPLGKALMGHKAGDTVHVTVNETIGYDAQIIEVTSTGDEDEDALKSF